MNDKRNQSKGLEADSFCNISNEKFSSKMSGRFLMTFVAWTHESAGGEVCGVKKKLSRRGSRSRIFPLGKERARIINATGGNAGGGVERRRGQVGQI